jgi:hypothetical protein
MPQVASTQCRVGIVAPNGAQFHFKQTDYEHHLLAVETRKDLGEAVGSFTLHMTAIRDQEGRGWHELIPRRSLVFIDMDRPDDPDLDTADTTVMVGLTDSHSIQESWESAAPRRRVTISGRELSSVILDAQMIFHPGLLAKPGVGILTMTGPGRDTPNVATLALSLAWNPNLAKGGESPIKTLSRILDYFLFVGGSAVVTNPDIPGSSLQQPLIQIDLPDVLLSDLLQKNEDHWSTFDDVQVPMPYQTSEAGSLWNYLHLFIDRYFQEFFTRVEDGVCKIHFRGKPFRQERVTSGTRFKTREETQNTLQTLTLDPANLLALATQRQTDNVKNFFLVEPLGIADLFQDPNYRYRIMPQIVDEPEHPSFVGRYGLRPMVDKSPYLAPWVPTTPVSPGGPIPAAPASVQPLTPPPAGKSSYAPMANQIAEQQGIPPEQRPWFVANIHTESSFNPNATSPKGAQGLGQIMPANQAHLGVTNPYDPVQSLTGSARYWNELRADPAIGNDPIRIVAAYNAGPGAVRAAGGVPPFAETQKHVRLVSSRMPQYQGYAGTTAPPVPSPTPGAAPPQASTTALDATGVIETAQHWAAILRAWYDMGGELFSGVLTVRGHPAWNIGHRLVSRDERGNWEAYIEGVSHQYDMRTGQYLTQLRITRGWYLSAAIVEQLQEEGQTMITETTGGPPAIDPATGELQGPSVGEVRVISMTSPDAPGVELAEPEVP